MTSLLKRLYHGQPSTAGGTVYTCPANTATTVLGRVISNPTASPLTVRLGLIPAGGTGDGTHYLLGDVTIPANQSYESDTKIMLAAGDILEAQSASLPAPSNLQVATAATGGTLAAATYYYKVTGTNANGETLGSTEVTVTTTGTTSANTLSWARLLGATGYKVYRSTATNAEVFLATVSGGATTSYADAGTAASGATPPSAGTAAGCIFTISGLEQS